MFMCNFQLDVRLQLLEHYKQPFLLKSLYAILMILPNSRAYLMLQERLKDVSSLHKNLPAQVVMFPSKYKFLKYEELKQHFIDINLPVNRRNLNCQQLGLSEKQMIETRYSYYH